MARRWLRRAASVGLRVRDTSGVDEFTCSDVDVDVDVDGFIC